MRYFIKKKVVGICLFFAIATTIFSCVYEKAELKSDCVLPATVSFSNNVQPIFNTYCNVSGCHNGISHSGSLNLESTVSYAQLTAHGTGYIDTLNPQFSLLYSKLTSTSDVMPPSGRLDVCKISLILQWIKQKAKNN